MKELEIVFVVVVAIAFAAGALAIQVVVNLMLNVGPDGHCWMRGMRHDMVWMSRNSEHQLFDYQHCARCGWPGEMRKIPEMWREE